MGERTTKRLEGVVEGALEGRAEKIERGKAAKCLR
jgi:hypothetical protein